MVFSLQFVVSSRKLETRLVIVFVADSAHLLRINFDHAPATVSHVGTNYTMPIYVHDLGVPATTRTRSHSVAWAPGSSGLARLLDLPQPG